MNSTFVRDNLIAILAIIAFVWLMFKPSGCGKDIFQQEPTITEETVTEQVEQPPVYIPVYVPQQSGSTSYPVVIPQQYQPSAELEKLLTQYNELVKDYLAVRNYKDSIQLKDSSGNRVGVVNLNDKVTENKLVSREPSYQLSFPHTTKTITIREPYKPVNKVYGGFGITGNQTNPLNGVKGGLLFQNKKDAIIGADAGIILINGQIQPQFELSRYWKIRLGKK